VNRKSIGNLLLLVSALGAAAVSFHQSGWNAGVLVSGFEAWIILPYVLCWLLAIPLYQAKEGNFAKTAVYFSGLVLLYTLWSYGGLYYGHRSSTEGLVFLFVPLYLIAASVAVLGAANVVRHFRSRRSGAAA
jgi:hypothetical protein